ncbi:MAG: hypothetical protein ACXVCG_17090 [Bdellovibrionota bacterium]
METPSSKPAAENVFRMARLLTKVFCIVVAILAYRLWASVSADTVHNSFAEAGRNAAAWPMAITAVVAAAISFVMKKIYARPKAGMSESAASIRKFTGHMLALALSETSAVAGFSLGLTTHNFEIAIPFFALTYVLYVFYWPRASDFYLQ